jgi:hypothetical protein
MIFEAGLISEEERQMYLSAALAKETASAHPRH